MKKEHTKLFETLLLDNKIQTALQNMVILSPNSNIQDLLYTDVSCWFTWNDSLECDYWNNLDERFDGACFNAYDRKILQIEYAECFV